MAWAKFDDQVTFHPKIVEAGNSAVGLWLRMTTYCCAQLTDGLVPESVAILIGNRRDLDRAVRFSLVEKVDGGYRVHDFHDYQPTADEVRSHRDQTAQTRAEAGKLGGIKSGMARRHKANANQSGSKIEANAKQNEANESKQNEAPSRPVPSGSTPPTPSGSENTDPDLAWFAALWKQRSGVLIPETEGLRDTLSLVRQYRAETEAVALRPIAEALLDGYATVIAEWSVPIWTAVLFRKHWETVQQNVKRKRESTLARAAQQSLAARGDG